MSFLETYRKIQLENIQFLHNEIKMVKMIKKHKLKKWLPNMKSVCLFVFFLSSSHIGHTKSTLQFWWALLRASEE